jgi:hypothetical protein
MLAGVHAEAVDDAHHQSRAVAQLGREGPNHSASRSDGTPKRSRSKFLQRCVAPHLIAHLVGSPASSKPVHASWRGAASDRSAIKEEAESAKIFIDIGTKAVYWPHLVLLRDRS